jgi:hypothetical protein
MAFLDFTGWAAFMNLDDSSGVPAGSLTWTEAAMRGRYGGGLEFRAYFEAIRLAILERIYCLGLNARDIGFGTGTSQFDVVSTNPNWPWPGLSDFRVATWENRSWRMNRSNWTHQYADNAGAYRAYIQGEGNQPQNEGTEVDSADRLVLWFDEFASGRWVISEFIGSGSLDAGDVWWLGSGETGTFTAQGAAVNDIEISSTLYQAFEGRNFYGTFGFESWDAFGQPDGGYGVMRAFREAIDFITRPGDYIYDWSGNGNQSFHSTAGAGFVPIGLDLTGDAARTLSDIRLSLPELLQEISDSSLIDSSAASGQLIETDLPRAAALVQYHDLLDRLLWIAQRDLWLADSRYEDSPSDYMQETRDSGWQSSKADAETHFGDNVYHYERLSTTFKGGGYTGPPDWSDHLMSRENVKFLQKGTRCSGDKNIKIYTILHDPDGKGFWDEMGVGEDHYDEIDLGLVGTDVDGRSGWYPNIFTAPSSCPVNYQWSGTGYSGGWDLWSIEDLSPAGSGLIFKP